MRSIFAFLLMLMVPLALFWVPIPGAGSLIGGFLGGYVDGSPGRALVLAVASDSLDEAPIDVNATPPVAPVDFTSRSVVASTEWLAKVSAIAVPSAALVPCVSPVAFVTADAVWVAIPVRLPVSTSGPVPLPTEALVETFEIERATTGVTSGAPPVPAADAPPLASVSIVSPVVACRPTLPAPVSVEPLPRPAVVVSFTTFSATDAPTPVFEPDGLAGSACASSSAVEAAAIRTSPLTAADSPAGSTASVSSVTTLTASDPATPTFAEPPAPEVEAAANLLVPVAGATASSPTCAACSVTLLTRARVVTAATAAATATPTPAALAGTALPSADALAALTEPAWMNTGGLPAAGPPPAVVVTVMPPVESAGAMYASVVGSRSVNASAPATGTAPALVLA